MLIAVAGSAYDSAAEAWAAGNRRAADVADDLAAGLAGSAGMGGDDASSADFVAAYDDGARETLAALDDLTTAFATLTGLTDIAADQHRAADARAALGAPAWVGRGTGDRGVVVPAHLAPPSALGADTGASTPELWDLVVDHLQGLAWPSADVPRLRDAAALWRETGHRVRGLTASLSVGEAALADQRSPEVPLALAAGAELREHCTTLADTCADLAGACTEHADRTETVRQVVRDLLTSLATELAIAAAGSAIGAVVTFGGTAVAFAATTAVRVASCARSIVAALKSLPLVRAASLALHTYPRVRSVRTALEKFRNIRLAQAATRRLDDTLWSRGRYPGDISAQLSNAIRHTRSHAHEFDDVRDTDEYVRAAKAFLRDPPVGTSTRIRHSRGRVAVMRYDTSSNTLGIMTADGQAATFFRPQIGTHGFDTNMDYFLRSQ